MGSMEVGSRRSKAMWLYPRVLGFNPSERWGHSACCFEGVLYAFGGCCGGLHFSDVLALNLDAMAWNSFVTTGHRPGTRDSHSAALIGHKMVVLGGTNGTKKVNDLHILDLRTKEWTKPNCKGAPPSPRESHTTTVVGEDKLVVFGGSGEGEANYLNDVHVLHLNTMTWSSPDVKGDLPAPRDSHTAVAVGNKLLVYGGDCGDRYHGDVHLLDMETMAWSRLSVQGSSPGVRAGHAAVTIGSRVYVIGGVGDKQYYSDVWVFDVIGCSWTLLDIRGQQPQGRFSHTAVVTGTDIAIYGGCGEDERPLNELLILQLGSEHPNGRYNISMCKIFGNHLNQERRKLPKGSEISHKSTISKNGEHKQRTQEAEIETRNPALRDNLQTKKRKLGEGKAWEVELEQEEHSLSLSQHSSPSRSDQEQNNAPKANESVMPSRQFVQLKSRHPKDRLNGVQVKAHDVNSFNGESSAHPKSEQFVHVVSPAKQELPSRPNFPHIIGAEVHGTVDGAFDSGYLMTANVNGQILRGVLFAPGPGFAIPRPALHSPSSHLVSQQCSTVAHAIPIHIKPATQASNYVVPECGHHLYHAHPIRAVKSQPSRPNNDLQGVVLTLGGPGGGGA